ncbi:MAG: putative phage abortive infection protein [Methylococcales bacterium]|nr:putative phage abortive infection protein [Methylococcales bacterium]
MLNKIREFWIKHYIAITAIVAVVVVLGFYFFKFHHQLSDDNGNWGTFGDFFGGTLNPILSFLALMVLLRTFSMQREELDLQREELKETKAILKEQSETQKRQQFENTFFELLKIHNQLLKNLLKRHQFIKPDGEKIDVFDEVMNDILSKNDESMSPKMAQFIVSERLEPALGMDLWGTYLRTLYQLLKFIAINSPDNEISNEFEIDELKDSEVGIYEKIYSNMVRALLPDEIMRLLSLNCYITTRDKKNYHKYKMLIERYAFFEHASFNQDDDTDSIFSRYPLLLEIRKAYEPRAFGRIEPFK